MVRGVTLIHLMSRIESPRLSAASCNYAGDNSLPCVALAKSLNSLFQSSTFLRAE